MPRSAFRTALTFDDVLLEPGRTDVVRSEVDLRARLTKKIVLDIPILASAMDTVSEAGLAIALGKLGGMAVLHRNCTPEYEADMVRQVKRQKLLAGASIGPHDISRGELLQKAGADVLFVDCASAHNTRIIKSIRQMKRKLKVPIVVGNIATVGAAKDFIKIADALKVGVGPGSICTTRVVTGVGVPQLTAIMDVVDAVKGVIPVIADGGLKYSGDIVKALAAGASTVMLGSMLAGTKEAPGRIIKQGGVLYKEYRGMGSLGAMQKGQSTDRYFQKGDRKYTPEGVEAVIPYKGPLADVISQLIGGLRSGMGYIGAKTIGDMPKRARFVQITPASLKESHPHSVTINKKAPNY